MAEEQDLVIHPEKPTFRELRRRMRSFNGGATNSASNSKFMQNDWNKKTVLTAAPKSVVWCEAT